MPHIEDQDYAKILETYSDTHTRFAGEHIDTPDADVINFFGDANFVDSLKNGVMEFGNYNGRAKLNTLVILAKQKALEEADEGYSLESLVDLENPENNSPEIKARTKEILEDLISDPEIEQEKDDDPDEYKNRVQNAKREKFFTEFFKPEVDRLTGKLVEDFLGHNDMSESEFGAHMQPYKMVLDGLFDTYNQEFMSSREPDELSDCLDTEAKLQMLKYYSNGQANCASAADSAYTSVADGNLPDSNNLTGVIASTFAAKHTRDNFEKGIHAIENSVGQDKRNVSLQFENETYQLKNNIDGILYENNGLLAHLTDKERIIFTLDPKIREDLIFEEGPGNRVDVFYKGIDLQVHTPANEIAPGEDLEKLKDAIEGAYTVHRIEAKLDAARDLRKDSLKSLADGLRFCEEELKKNSLFYKHFSNYGDMQDAIADFRKYADRLSKKGNDITERELVKLSNHLQESLQAVNTYLEGKGALNGRTDFKAGAETARVGAARMLGSLLEQTAGTLNKAYENNTRKKQIEEYQFHANNGIKYAEEHVPGFVMPENAKKSFLSTERVDACIAAREKRKEDEADNLNKSAYVPLTDETRLGSRWMAYFPLEYMSDEQRIELYNNLKANKHDLRLKMKDLNELEDSLKLLMDSEKKRAKEKEQPMPEPVEKAAEGGNILPENAKDNAPNDSELDKVLNIDAFKIRNELNESGREKTLFDEGNNEIKDEINECEAKIAQMESMKRKTQNAKEDLKIQKGYVVFLNLVLAARKNLYDHWKSQEQYFEYAGDMKMLALYAEFKHPEQKEKKERFSKLVMSCDSPEDVYVLAADMSSNQAIRNLMQNTTPSTDKKGEVVTNRESAMKAMHSFLFEDGAEMTYQRAVFFAENDKKVAEGNRKTNQRPQIARKVRSTEYH